MKIEIQREGSAAPMMIDVHETDGGLALHRSPGFDKLWTVTHIASGSAVLKGIGSHADAVTALGQLAKAFDWDQDVAEIRGDPDKLGRLRIAILEIAEVVGAVRPIWAHDMDEGKPPLE